MESSIIPRHRHNFAKWLEELEAMPKEMLTTKELSTMEMLQKMKASYAPLDTAYLKIDSRPTYYDKKGNPMTLWEWSGYHSDLEYKIIKQDHFGPFFVSTVWLGMDHGYSCFTKKSEPYFPVIFETMIFDNRDDDKKDELDLWQDRYSFEQQALDGHEVACEIAAEKAWKLQKAIISRL